VVRVEVAYFPQDREEKALSDEQAEVSEERRPSLVRHWRVVLYQVVRVQDDWVQRQHGLVLVLEGVELLQSENTPVALEFLSVDRLVGWRGCEFFEY
jgi:hypothetical protein